jgi:hypothetical protein
MARAVVGRGDGERQKWPSAGAALGEARYPPPAEAVCPDAGGVDARVGECGPRQAGELDRGRRGRQLRPRVQIVE